MIYKAAIGDIRNDRRDETDNAVVCVRPFRAPRPQGAQTSRSNLILETCKARDATIVELEAQSKFWSEELDKQFQKNLKNRVKPELSCERWGKAKEDLDLIPMNSQCVTAGKVRLERKDDPDFGLSWFDTQTLLLWSDDLDWATNKGSSDEGHVKASPAQALCKSKNARLPSRDEFRIAFEAHRLGEVLHSHVVVQDGFGARPPSFWTGSTTLNGENELAYVYGGIFGNDAHLDYREKRRRVRCVKEAAPR